MNPLLTSLFVTALALAINEAPAAQFFVAPGGNDANPGSKEEPFATLPRAMAAVRSLRSEIREKKQPAGPVHVILRGGVYEVREPIVFTPADSGTADAPVTYQAAPGEEVVFSGGQRLTGAWTRTPGKPFWQLDLPGARDGKWVFHSLYVKGQSRTRARHPNYGDKVLRAEGREPGGDPRQALRYFPGDVDPAWSNPTDIDVVLLCSWTPTLHRVKEIDPERRAIRFFSGHGRSVDFWERNFRYYVANVFEALDEPGEWYLNRHSGTLYYYPHPGEDLSKAEIVAPVMRSTMIEFAGDLANGRGIEHLHFRDLCFRHVDGDMDRHNGVYRQGHMYLGAAVVARGLRRSSFERCELAHLGEYAMELADGCRDVAVRQCHFHDLGAGAMQLGVTDLGTLKTPFEPGSKAGAEVVPEREVRGLVIDNNCIHRLGTLWHGCYGIVNRFASQTKITHNEIFDTHWDAIGLDARWSWKGEKYAHGNEVAYNHLHHLGLRYHTDAAGVYQFGPLDTHIHHNLIHDTAAYPYICGYAGIYLDEQSRHALVENNLVYNVEWYAYFQNKGTDNLFRNNIGAFARNGFIGRGGLDATWPGNYFEVTRNLYIAKDGVGIGRSWLPGEKPPLLHGNLYHNLDKDTPLTFAGKSFAEWQASGQDEKSVLADPGCRNPAAYDFALPPDAAACKAIGFVPFDAELAKAGLYGDPAWRALPGKQSLRKPSAVWTEEEFARFNAFELDFNLMKEGDVPGVFRMSEQKGAGFAVTSEVPGVKGPRCLKVTDKQGVAKGFYPYIHFSPRGLKEGTITFTLAVRQPAESPARLQLDFRSSGETPVPGPSLAIGRDGVVRAGSRTIAKLEPEAWTRFELRFTLGGKGAPSYVVVVRNESGESIHTIPFANPAFAEIGWLGLTTPDDADGVCYLDELSMRIGEAEANLPASGIPDREGRVKAVTETPGLVAFWDFVKREPEGAGRFTAHVPPGATNEYALDAGNYVKEYWGEGREATYEDFPLLGRGPFGQSIRIRKEEEPAFRPFLFVPRGRLHDSPLDIKGAGKSVTVVVWAVRESGNHALAGIWHEGTDLKEKTTATIQKVERGQRQYALFAGLNKEGSACGHVSENGASSFLNKYALHKCNSGGISPAVPADSSPEVLDSSWQCFAMTFDNERDELTGWLNGEAGDRWLTNPKDDKLISSAWNAWVQGRLHCEPGAQEGEDPDFPADQFYNPPEDKPLSVQVLSEEAGTRVELREYPYTRVKVTLRKGEEGQFAEVSRELAELRLNPWWYPHGIYTPPDATSGGPFTIGRVIHSGRSVGFTGWIGGVAVFDRALNAEELSKLAALASCAPVPAGPRNP